VTTGVNNMTSNKLMKTVGNTDTLTFFLDKSEGYNRLGIRVENDEKRSVRSTSSTCRLDSGS
jgi:hypothetical protein